MNNSKGKSRSSIKQRDTSPSSNLITQIWSFWYSLPLSIKNFSGYQRNFIPIRNYYSFRVGYYFRNIINDNNWILSVRNLIKRFIMDLQYTPKGKSCYQFSTLPTPKRIFWQTFTLVDMANILFKILHLQKQNKNSN